MSPTAGVCATTRCRARTKLNDAGYCPTCIRKQEEIDKDKTPYPCAHCSKNISNDDGGLMCEMCLEWNHSVCVDISKEGYLWLKKLPGSRWFCKKCDSKLEHLIEKANSLEIATKTLQTEMTTVQERLDKVEKKLQGSVKTEISSALSEQNDIEKRKLNLVVYNLPEVEDTENTVWDLPTKIDKDIKSISHIIETHLKINMGIDTKNALVDARRLGKKPEASPQNKNHKPRPLKIIFSDLSKKRDVLTAAKELRKTEDPMASKLFINPDLTEQQRNKDKELRDKMWERREKYHENAIIRKGEIVIAPFEVRKQRTNSKNTKRNISAAPTDPTSS